MSFITAAIVGSAVVGAGASIYGANQAAGAQTAATKKGIEAQKRAFNQQLALQEPTRYLGYQAGSDLAALYGYGMAPYMTYSDVHSIGTKQGTARAQYNDYYGGQATGGTAPGAAPPGAPAGAGNMSRFFTSPDYQFRMNEGMDAIKNLASARGGVGGNVMREGANFASGLASGEFNQYVSRLMQLAGFGASATNQTGQAAGQMGANVGNLYAQQGNARASAYMTGAAGVNSAIQGGLQNWAFQNYLNQQPVGQPTASPYGPYAGGYRFPDLRQPWSTPPIAPPGIGGN